MDLIATGNGVWGMNDAPDVVVGAPIYRAGAYVLYKFLANQKEIQPNYTTRVDYLLTKLVQ